MNKKKIAVICAAVCVIALIAGIFIWHSNSADKPMQDNSPKNEKTVTSSEDNGQDTENAQDPEESKSSTDVETPVVSVEQDDSEAETNNVPDDKDASSQEQKSSNNDTAGSGSSNKADVNNKEENPAKDSTDQNSTNKNNINGDKPIELPVV